MGRYRLGDSEVELKVVGAGVSTKELALQKAAIAPDLTPDQKRDREAFQKVGWSFTEGGAQVWEENLNLAGRSSQEKKGLLAEHPSGGLVILRDRLVIQLRPGVRKERAKELLDRYANSWKLGFGRDLYEVKLKLEGPLQEEVILKELKELQEDRANEILFAEPSLLYHVKPKLVELDGNRSKWHWERIQLTEAWNCRDPQIMGDGVRVAVIDLGFYPDEQIDPNVDWRVSLDEDGDIISRDDTDRNFHGTLCAGLIGAKLDEKEVNGAAPKCKLGLVSIKEGVCSQVALGKALALCALPDPGRVVPDEQKAHLISCSLGLGLDSWELCHSLRAAIRRVHNHGRQKKGVPIVWACFNRDQPIRRKSLEAHHPLIIVSQSDDDDRRIDSGWGAGLDLLAPGYGVVGIVSDLSGRKITKQAGSSLAAPIVAGVAALVLEANSELSWRQVADVLRNSCDRRPNTTRWSKGRGCGRLNAKEAVSKALELARKQSATAAGPFLVHQTPAPPDAPPPAPPGSPL